ncbi:hypothetical protein [Campylobacter concisus]
MVSLLCGCCAEKPITSLQITRVFKCYFEVEPTSYRYYEIKRDGEHALIAFLNGFKYSSFSKKTKNLFDTSFYMANFVDYAVEFANVPLHRVKIDHDNFRFKLGADFLTPFGEDKMVKLPTASHMSSYLVSDLFFDNPVSDYFYFFVSCDLDFSKCQSDLDFFDTNNYRSSSPFFRVPGVPNIIFANPISFARLPYHSQFFNLCSRGFIYDFSDFYPIFQQGFLSTYSKFYNDVMNFNYHKSYFSVFRFSKKDYYAYIQNNSTAG